MTTVSAPSVPTHAASEPIIGALFDGVRAAAFIGRSPKTWRRWAARGLVPVPIRIGSRQYWRRSELERWLVAGCPPARRFQVLRAAGLTHDAT